LECLETPVFDPKPSKTEFFDPKQEIISKLFLQNFCEFEKTGYFKKNYEL